MYNGPCESILYKRPGSSPANLELCIDNFEMLLNGKMMNNYIHSQVV